MNPRRFVMTASALVLGVIGLAASFAPQEIGRAAGVPANAGLSLIVQLAGALYLSMAVANWTGRESLIGGIYARPLALANLLHFTMGTLALVKHVASNDRTILLLAIVYAVFAVAFGRILFTSPITRATRESG